MADAAAVIPLPTPLARAVTTLPTTDGNRADSEASRARIAARDDAWEAARLAHIAALEATP